MTRARGPALASLAALALGCVDAPPALDADLDVGALDAGEIDGGEPDAWSRYDAPRMWPDVIWAPDAAPDAYRSDAHVELGPGVCSIDTIRDPWGYLTIEHRSPEGLLTLVRWVHPPESGGEPSYRDFEYDDEDRLVTTTYGTTVPVNTTHLEYSDTEVLERGVGATTRWVLASGRVIAIDGPLEAPVGERGGTTVTYDDAANVASVEGRSFDHEALWNTTTTIRYDDYDAAGRPGYLERTSRITSAIDGALIEESSTRRRVRYEDDGRVLRVWAEDLERGELRLVETEVDADGRLVRHAFDHAPGRAGGETLYVHDDDARVTRIFVRGAVAYVLRGDCAVITHPTYEPRVSLPAPESYVSALPQAYLGQLFD